MGTLLGLCRFRRLMVSQADEIAALVARAKEDPEAFGRLYEIYVNRIYNYIYYRVGNHHDAEDLTARTFYRALAHIGSYTEQGIPFSAWLYRIAHNLVANWHRDRSRRQEVPLETIAFWSAERDAPEHLIEAEEERRWLLDVIHRLPPERQQLLILKFVERLSNKEIGEIMGRSEGAIKSLYHRTLLALREEMEKRRQEEEKEEEP